MGETVRADLLKQWDDIERDAADLLGGLTDAQLNWKPEPAAWSIAQCVDHLNVADRVYLAAMRKGAAAAAAAAHPDQTIRPGWFARWFLKQLEPPVKRRMPAPSLIAPARAKTVREVQEEFEEKVKAARAFFSDCAAVDWNRTRFPNPFIKGLRFTLAAGAAIMCAHNRRHLRQARNVKEAPAFPKS